MTTLFRVIALGALLVLVAVAPVSATGGNPDHAVPISGWSIGSDTVTFGACEGGWRYDHQGSGYLSHLGVVQVTVSHCSRFTGPTTGAAGPGTMVMTAANGDQLFFSESATFEITFGPNGPSSSVIALEWQIIGGTGRFAGASGSGTGSGFSSVANGTTEMAYAGSIVYDASNRSAAAE